MSVELKAKRLSTVLTPHLYHVQWIGAKLYTFCFVLIPFATPVFELRKQKTLKEQNNKPIIETKKIKKTKTPFPLVGSVCHGCEAILARVSTSSQSWQLRLVQGSAGSPEPRPSGRIRRGVADPDTVWPHSVSPRRPCLRSVWNLHWIKEAAGGTERKTVFAWVPSLKLHHHVQKMSGGLLSNPRFLCARGMCSVFK